MHGRDFCLYYKSNVPAILRPTGPIAFDLVVESPEWGNGISRGMLLFKSDGVFDIREMITIPGDNPKYKRN